MKGVKFGTTRKELLALPVCKFAEQGKRKYAALLIVPAKELDAESGYRLMAIVGLDKEGKPIEIADFCDSIEWRIPMIDAGRKLAYSPLRPICMPTLTAYMRGRTTDTSSCGDAVRQRLRSFLTKSGGMRNERHKNDQSI